MGGEEEEEEAEADVLDRPRTTNDDGPGGEIRKVLDDLDRAWERTTRSSIEWNGRLSDSISRGRLYVELAVDEFMRAGDIAGLALPKAPRHRIPPDLDVGSYLYLKTNDAELALRITQLMQELGTEIGLTVAEILQVRQGSIVASFRSFWGRFVASRTYQKTVPEVVAEATRALQAKTIDRYQAEVDALNGSTVANLLNSIDEVTDATVKVGSILILKSNVRIDVRVLTAIERTAIEKYPGLLQDPAGFDRALAEIKQLDMDLREPPNTTV